jgi:hypothetical protein
MVVVTRVANLEHPVASGQNSCFGLREAGPIRSCRSLREHGCLIAQVPPQLTVAQHKARPDRDRDAVRGFGCDRNCAAFARLEAGENSSSPPFGERVAGTARAITVACAVSGGNL